MRVSKNNFTNYMKQHEDQTQHFGLRKLSIGVASVLLSTTLYFGGVGINHNVLADSRDANTTEKVNDTSTAGSDSTNTEQNSEVKSTDDQANKSSEVTVGATNNSASNSKDASTTDVAVSKSTDNKDADSISTTVNSSKDGEVSTNSIDVSSSKVATSALTESKVADSTNSISGDSNSVNLAENGKITLSKTTIGNDGTTGSNRSIVAHLYLATVKAGEVYKIAIPRSSTYASTGVTAPASSTNFAVTTKNDDPNNWYIIVQALNDSDHADIRFVINAESSNYTDTGLVKDSSGLLTDVGTKTYNVVVTGTDANGNELGSVSSPDYQAIVKPQFNDITYTPSSGIRDNVAVANRELSYTINVHEALGIADGTSNLTGKVNKRVNHGSIITIPMPKGFVLNVADTQAVNESGVTFSQDSEGNVIINASKATGDLSYQPSAGYVIKGSYNIDTPDTDTTLTASGPITVKQIIDDNGTTITGTGTSVITQVVVGKKSNYDGEITYGWSTNVELYPYGYSYGTKKAITGKYNNPQLAQYTAANNSLTKDVKNPAITINVPDGLAVTSFNVNDNSTTGVGTKTYTVYYEDGTSESGTISDNSQLGNGKTIKQIVVKAETLPSLSSMSVTTWGNTAETYRDGSKTGAGFTLKDTTSLTGDNINAINGSVDYHIDSLSDLKAKASFAGLSRNNSNDRSDFYQVYFVNGFGKIASIKDPVFYYVLPTGVYFNGTIINLQGNPTITTETVNGHQVVKVDYTGTNTSYKLDTGNGIGNMNLGVNGDAVDGNYTVEGFIKSSETVLDNDPASKASDANADYFGGSLDKVYYIGQATFPVTAISSLSPVALVSGNKDHGLLSGKGSSDDKGSTAMQIGFNIVNNETTPANGDVMYLNIPSNGLFKVTGPVTAPAGLTGYTIYYSKSATDLNNAKVTDINNSSVWTSDTSSWTEADWAQVKSIAVSLPSIAGNTNTGRFIINGEDPTLAQDAGKTLAVASAIASPVSKTLVVNESSNSAPKLTISGTSTIKTALQYTDADGQTHTVNLNYTKQYQDNSSTMNYSDFPSVVSGFSSEDQATINALIAKGYKFVPLSDTNNTILDNGGKTWQSDSTNNPDGSAAWGSQVKYYFDGDTVVYTLGHGNIDVTPNDGKSSTDKLPNESGNNYPDGVTNQDLTKTVTRTINIYGTDGKTIINTIKQDVKFKKTAHIDAVTGKITGYSDYSSFDDNNGKYSEQNFDTPAGYTSSVTYKNTNTTDTTSGKVTTESATDKDGNPVDETVDVKFTAIDQHITIKYADDDNNGSQVGDDQTVKGKTDETVTPTYTIPEGYDYVSGKVDSHTMTADDNTVITVHLKHHHTTADKKITKTITYKTDEGDSVAPDYTQSVTIHKDTDEATGTSTYSVDGKTLENGQTTLGSQSLPSKPGYYASTVPEGATSDSTVSFDSSDITENVVYKKLGKIIPVDEKGNPIPGADTPIYSNNSDDPTKAGDTTTPTVPGYTASKTTVPGSEITNPGEDTKVTYTANPQTITIKYVDDDNKGAQVGTDQSVPGKTGETVTPEYTIPTGYDYVSGKVDSHTMTADDNTVITVHLKHHHTTADKKITKTITYKTDEGDSVADNFTQSVTIHKDTDEATGTSTYSVEGKTLENGTTTLGSQKLPSKDGYYVATVPEGATSVSTVNFDSSDITENVVYKKLGKIIPVDEKGNPIPGADTPTYSNNSDDPTKAGDTTTPTVPGYTATKTTVPGSDITNPGDNTPVTYTPNTQTIKVVVTDSTTGKTITVDVPTSFNGKSDEKVGTDVTDGVQNVVNTLKKLGYTITNQGETPTSFDHSQNESSDSDNNPQVINITVGHNHTATEKTITKTITYKTDEGDSVAPDYTQSVTIHKDTDEATGTSTYSVDGKTLENGQTTLGSQKLPSKDGYYAANVPEGATSDSTVSFDSSDITENVVYKKLGKIIPVDEKGNPIPGADTPTYSNNSDDPTKAGDTTTPTVPGYTASKTTVPGSEITNPGEDTKVTYTANKKTTNIVFKDQDNNNETVKTVPVDGHTSETVTVDQSKTTIPAGYELVSGNTVPTTITFAGGNETTPDTVVYLKHKTTTVTPDTDTTKTLPDNPKKNYPTTEALTKTVTRTINVHNIDGTVTTETQQVKFTRTATVDEVTGEVTNYSDWAVDTSDKKPSEFEAYNYTTPSGYTSKVAYNTTEDKAQAGNGTVAKADASTTTDGKTTPVEGGTVDIYFVPEKQTITVTVTDQDGNPVVISTDIPTIFNGTTNSKVGTDVTDGVTNITTYLKNHGYEVTNQSETPKNFDDTDNTGKDSDQTPQNISITVKHKTVDVTPDKPKTTTDNLPDNPDTKYPSGVTETDLNKTITRTIVEVDPVTKESKTVATQPVHYTRTATVDEVTGKVTYTDWTTTDKWAAYTPTNKPGYTPSQKSVDESTPAVTDKDQTVTINYTANPAKTSVVFVDDNDNGKTVKTVTVNGTTSGTTPLSDDEQKIPNGYELVDGNKVPTEIKFNNDGSDTPSTTVHLKHKTTTVNPDSPKTTSDTLPDNPDKNYSSGVSETDLNKTITRTIVEVDPLTGEHKTVATQPVHYTRTAKVDEVNGKVTYTDWTTTNKTWPEYTASKKTFFTPSQEKVSSQEVPVTATDTTVTITYTLNPDGDPSFNFFFYDGGDSSEKPISSGKIPVKVVDGKVVIDTDKIKSEIPKGYELIPGKTIPTDPATLEKTSDGTYKLPIPLQHKTTTVTPENPAKTGDKLPDNPDKTYPDGVDTTKTVTRTINVHKPDGTTETTKQTVTFTRTVTVDEVTGKVVKTTDWTSTKPDYPAYTVPAVDGYTPSQTTVEKVTPKATDSDSTVDVTYTGNVQTIKVVVTDKTTGKEVTIDVPTTFNGTSDAKTGKDVTDGVEKIKDYLKQKGYSVPDKIEIPSTFDHSQNKDSKTDDHPQVITITVDHTYTTNTETSAHTWTIHFTGAGDKTPQDQTYTVHYTRQVTVDNVTGDSTATDWTTTDKYPDITVPAIDGYKADHTNLHQDVDQNDHEITVVYTKVNKGTIKHHENKHGENKHHNSKHHTYYPHRLNKRHYQKNAKIHGQDKDPFNLSVKPKHDKDPLNLNVRPKGNNNAQGDLSKAKSQLPQTGEKSNNTLVKFGLLAISLTGLLGMMAKNKRRDD